LYLCQKLTTAFSELAGWLHVPERREYKFLIKENNFLDPVFNKTL